MAVLAEAWRQRAIDGFRAAYRKAMRGCPSYPASKLQAKALIDFFTLEKAVYEVALRAGEPAGLGGDPAERHPARLCEEGDRGRRRSGTTSDAAPP